MSLRRAALLATESARRHAAGDWGSVQLGERTTRWEAAVVFLAAAGIGAVVDSVPPMSRERELAS